MAPTVSSTTPSTDGYKVDNQQSITENVPNPSVPIVPPIVNINDLFQKLVASGFVTTTQHQIQQPENKPPQKVDPPDSTQQAQAPPTKIRRSVAEYLKPITFDKPETLKVRQSSLYGALYSGMQCSSCGMRFSPEASMLYSQHLDWHFRQNRKGKRNIRVAASRRWYYSLADWKNYEELEDLEERGMKESKKHRGFIILIVVYFQRKTFSINSNSNLKRAARRPMKKSKFLAYLLIPTLRMNVAKFVGTNSISFSMKKRRNGI